METLSGKENFNLAGVHLYSKLSNTERQQLWKNLPFVEKIDNLEKTQSNNRKTIVIGDFNYNPYESYFSDPSVFNAIDNRHLITNFKKNPIGKRKHEYWYNPMWNLLGDFDFKRKAGREATGTYFLYNDSEIPYWSMFDGVLLRPDLMNSIMFDETEVLTKTCNTIFLKPFIISDNDTYILNDLSDHLPFKLSLNIK